MNSHTTEERIHQLWNEAAKGRDDLREVVSAFAAALLDPASKAPPVEARMLTDQERAKLLYDSNSTEAAFLRGGYASYSGDSLRRLVADIQRKFAEVNGLQLKDEQHRLLPADPDISLIAERIAELPKVKWTSHKHHVEAPETEDWAAVYIECRANKLIAPKVARYIAACNPVAVAKLLAAAPLLVQPEVKP